MSSNSGLLPSSSKVVSSTSQTITPSHSQSGSSPTTESGSQRRTGGSGSFGAGAAARGVASPRNNQSLRKQSQKSQRRQRLADEDAIAESVSISSPHFKMARLNESRVSLGRDEEYQQQEGTNVHYPLDELLPSSTPAISTSLSAEQSIVASQADLGLGVWIPCSGQSKICPCQLPLHREAES